MIEIDLKVVEAKDRLQRTRKRLEEPRISRAAIAAHAAADKLIALVDARVPVLRELRDATHDRPAEHLDGVCDDAARAMLFAVVSLQVAEQHDPTPHARETFFVRKALAWLDADGIVFEADCLLRRADELDRLASAEPAPAAEQGGG